MLRFQVESVKDFKGSTWLTLMEGLEQPWTIKLLEKATEPATFAISKKSPTKFCQVIVIVCSSKNSEHWKGTPSFANSWPRHVPCKFMKILYHVFQYHYIFHGWIVTRSPPPLLYELLARCAWANRRIYVAKWWMVCLDPSLMNWDVLMKCDTIRHSDSCLICVVLGFLYLMTPSFISWGPASFMEPPLWWHWLQNLQNHRCMRCTQAALAPRWVNILATWLPGECAREYLSICSRWNVRFARNDWWGMASTDFGTALNQNWPEKLLRGRK